MTPENSSGGEPTGASNNLSGNLWGGRFREAPADVMWRFTIDQTDRRLLEIDIEGSIAHVAMLRKVGLLDDGEHAAIEEGLSRILAEARDGSFAYLDTDEDVHSAVERRLGGTGRRGWREASYRTISQRSDGPGSEVVPAASGGSPW